MLYIVLFLHQTTTEPASCQSIPVVYRTIPTSNHNVLLLLLLRIFVVYRTIPTSNHNVAQSQAFMCGLYIVLFLHQTTTMSKADGHVWCCISYYSYIKPQPLDRCTQSTQGCISYYSYIKPQQRVIWLYEIGSCISYYSYIKPQRGLLLLHKRLCCISYYSYIKPQRLSLCKGFLKVVYRTIPTSNHNYRLSQVLLAMVVYRTIPTSNHNL